MSRRVLLLTGLFAMVLLAAGGALLATSHSSRTSSPSSATDLSALPGGIDQLASIEPATCPAGCPVQISDCPSDGHPCTCPNGDHGKCCVQGTSISCVRTH